MALKITPDREPMVEEIQFRCVLVLVNEALRCFDEGVLPGARDGDVGAVLGRLPCLPWWPVPLRGPLERDLATEALARAPLRRAFREPTPPLVEMARKGRRFYG